MATSSVILDIRANTQRALGEFKAFSSQLDNKFLVSGLKLDVVRNALSQINREFQKSLGEQGLASAQSLKAAENQASILTNIYAGFSKNASSRIVEDFSSALNQVAVRTGSTVTDIQKTLSIAPYLSRNYSQGIRENILIDVQNLQTAARRAGLGGNTAQILNQFLTGQTGGIQLQESEDTLSKMLGAELTRVGGGVGVEAMSIAERTRILRAALENIDIEEFAKETGGFRAVLEQFSASLFNPKAGLLGAMREFTLKTGEAPTTLFKETTKLFESIFGPEGFIKTLGTELAKAFGIKGEDTAIKFLGRGIRFITNLINGLKELIDDILNIPIVRRVAEIIRSAFDGIVGFLKNLENIAANPPDFPDISQESIQEFIKEIGENVRGFLRKVGAFIRGEDISDEAQAGASIVGTIVDEAGKTMLTFFREVGDALLAKTGTIALELVKVLPGVIAKTIGAGLSGAGGITGFILSALGVGGLGLGASRFVGGIRQNILAGKGGIPGAANRFLGSPFGPIRPERSRVTSGRGGRPGPMGPPDLDDVLASIRNEPSSQRTPRGGRGFGSRIKDQYSRITAPRSQWPRPGVDIDLLQRRKAISEGRITASTSVLAGTIDELISPEDVLRRSAVRGGRITPETTMFKSPDVGELFPYLAINDPEINPKLKAAEIARQEVLKQERFSRYYKEAELNRKLRSRQSVRQRFTQRYGRRALLGAQSKKLLSGGMRGFGKGALVAGGTAALLGLNNLIIGEDAQAAEFDSATGQFIQPERPQVGAGQAFGAVGMGAAQGALTGMAFGPWGAAIGAVIGGGIALMDKGVRDAIGKSIKGFSDGVIKFGKDFIDGTKSAISDVFSNIGDLVGGIDWKGLLIRTLIPGGDFTIKGLQGIAEFASKLNVFDSIKTGLDTIASPVKDLWNKISSWSPPWGNFAGLNYHGPAMAKEMQMSGGSPLLVNDREFVIPRDGFPILADNVGRYLDNKTGSNSRDITMSPVFNITINATGLAGNDIAAAIQPAVIKILDDGMRQVSGNTVTRGATVI